MLSQRRAGVMLGYANILVKNLVQLVYTPMFLSFVSQTDYGVYQSSNSFVFSLSLLSFGFSEAYVRFYTQRRVNGTEDDIRKLNGMYLLLYVGICIVTVTLGLAFAANAGVVFSKGFTEEQVDLTRVLMSIMTFNIACTLFSTVFDAYILAHEQFRFQQSRQMFTTLATPGIAFLLLNLGMGVIGAATAQLAVNVLLLILNMRFAIGKLRMRFDLRGFDVKLFKSLAAFSAWIFANQICDLVNQSVPNVLLGALSGAMAVSIFAIAVNIRQVFYSLSTTMSSVFGPEINRIVATSDDNTELTRLMTRVGRYQMILFCWVYVGFAILGKFFIAKWAGEGFSEAYWLVLAMTLPVMVPLTQNTGIEIQRAKNMHKARSIVYLIMACINVIFTLVAAPALGYWAPAIAYVASIALGNGLWMNWYYQRRVGLDMAFFWKRNLPVILCTVGVTSVFLAATHYLPVSSWFSFLAWGALYSMVFAAGIFLLVMGKGERAAVFAKLGRRQ